MSEARNATGSPISQTINVTVLPPGGRQLTIKADADQRVELAAAHGLISVEVLEVEVDMVPWHRDGVRVTGTVRASVTQRCVVTLEPLPARIEAPFEARFAPEGSPIVERPEVGGDVDIEIDADGPDQPEPFAPPELDIGAVAEEFFALALDPYPRTLGAEAQSLSAGDDDNERDNPFAILGTLAPERNR